MANAYPELEKRFERMYLLRDAVTALEWDASTFMPEGGSQARADQMAVLRVMRHELLTAPDLGDQLAKAESESLDEWQKANLREMRREWIHATAVPASLVEARSQAVSTCEMRWRSARRDNDFAGLLPSFEQVLKLTREVGQAKSAALDVSPYDALLDEWEPGGRSQEIDRVFAAIEKFLPSMVDRVIEHQARRPVADPPRGPFSAEKQLQLAHSVMRMLGFDFHHGRIDTSAHPFCAGVPEDVRITTRWDEADFTNGLFAVIHETGHALYERGLPERFRKQPVGQARGMSTHESQSLLWEMQAARTPELVSCLAKTARDTFGGSGPEWDASALLGHVLRVERSLIRVDADEVTYPLHVILRYRLERAMIGGELQLKDLPSAFADGMQKLVGIRPPNVADGCLQDIHWPGGLWGYFPTYTLGALTAAQLYAAAVEAEPSIPASLARGETKPLLSWLVANVHSQGARFSGPEIVQRATGKPLDPEVFRLHLEKRYLD
ncbi:MAG: carboxypeptidase M32 [Polyangiales bacterium]